MIRLAQQWDIVHGIAKEVAQWTTQTKFVM